MGQIRLYLALIGIVSVLGGGALLYIKGSSHGYNKAMIEVAEATRLKQEQLFDLADTISRQNLELIRNEQDKEQLVRRLEDEARNDPNAVSRKPRPNELQRLRERFEFKTKETTK